MVSYEELTKDPYYIYKISKMDEGTKRYEEEMRLYEILTKMKKLFPTGIIPEIRELKRERRAYKNRLEEEQPRSMGWYENYEEYRQILNKEYEERTDLELLENLRFGEDNSLERRIFKRRRLDHEYEEYKKDREDEKKKLKLFEDQIDLLDNLPFNMNHRAFLAYMHRFSNVPPDTENIVAQFLGVTTIGPQSHQANLVWKWPQKLIDSYEVDKTLIKLYNSNEVIRKISKTEILDVLNITDSLPSHYPPPLTAYQLGPYIIEVKRYQEIYNIQFLHIKDSLQVETPGIYIHIKQIKRSIDFDEIFKLLKLTDNWIYMHDFQSDKYTMKINQEVRPYSKS